MNTVVLDDSVAVTPTHQGKRLFVWSKTRPPAFPRKPIMIDPDGRHIVEKLDIRGSPSAPEIR